MAGPIGPRVDVDTGPSSSRGGSIVVWCEAAVAFAAFQAATAALTIPFIVDIASFTPSNDRVLPELMPAVAVASLWMVAAIGLIRRHIWARWLVVLLVVTTNPGTLAFVGQAMGGDFLVKGILAWVVWASITAVYLLRWRRFDASDGENRVVRRVAPAGLFLGSLVLLGIGFVTFTYGALSSFVQMDRPRGADALV